MRTLYAGLFLCLFAFAACNTTSKTAEGETSTSATTQTVSKEPVRSKLNEEGTKNLVSTLASYYQLKDALVATSADKAKVAAADLAIKADSMKNSALRAGGNDSLVAYMDTVIVQSRNIAGMEDKTCEKQRIAFEPISGAIYTALKKAELKNAGVYHQYCPMAFNDKGAYWLSDISDIKNPYFGKKMLECGEVTDSL